MYIKSSRPQAIIIELRRHFLKCLERSEDALNNTKLFSLYKSRSMGTHSFVYIFSVGIPFVILTAMGF